MATIAPTLDELEAELAAVKKEIDTATEEEEREDLDDRLDEVEWQLAQHHAKAVR
jgi:hypothetical protein